MAILNYAKYAHDAIDIYRYIVLNVGLAVNSSSQFEPLIEIINMFT